MYTENYKKLSQKYYELAIHNNLAEPTDDEEKRRFITSEMISRAKGKAAIIKHFGNNDGLKYCTYTSTHDFDYQNERYEIKARRGEFTMDWFRNKYNRPMLPLRKTKEADYYLTITSDGYGICWRTSDYQYLADTPQDKTNDTFDGEMKVEPYAYYALSSALWIVKIDYDKFKKIDDILEAERQAHKDNQKEMMRQLRREMQNKAK